MTQVSHVENDAVSIAGLSACAPTASAALKASASPLSAGTNTRSTGALPPRAQEGVLGAGGPGDGEGQSLYPAPAASVTEMVLRIPASPRITRLVEPPGNPDGAVLVAGRGFEPLTFRL
jgi:hypothetical protein